MQTAIAILAFFALLAYAPAAPQGQGPGQQVQLPPIEAWSDSVCGVILSNPTDGSVRATVRTRTDVKRVTIDWTFLPEIPELDGMSTEVQNFTTRYWPTYACGFGADKVVVAGFESTGKTVLELWTFDTTSVDVYPPTKATRTTVENLILEDVPGRSVILQMVPTRYDPDVLLLRYYDSRDVYLFDTGTQVHTQVAGPGPTEPSGCIVVPELAATYGGLIARDHVTHGFAFVFRLPHSAQGRPVVVLIDSDRDGDLDSGDALTAAEWGAGGWSDPDNYQ